MAAAKLVTRCPACRTAFRLVADQLRLRQGLVRCGHCETVFDAREHLIEVPAPGASPSSPRTPSSQPVHQPAPAATTPAAEPETTPAPSATHFDPGYDPGYDVPALDSPTMMMAPAEDEETPADEMEKPAGFDTEPSPAEPAPVDADQEQPASPEEALPETAAESDTGNAAAIPDENAETHAGPAEDSMAEPAQAEQANAGPVAAANGKHHGGQGEEGSSAAILAAQYPWPELDRSVLEDPEPSRPVPGPVEAEPSEERPDEPAGEPASETAAEPVLRSASEFLRTQTSDSTEAPVSVADVPAQASTPSTPRDPGHDSGHDHDHAPGHDYGHNYGPTYGPSTGDAFSATAGAIARENATRRWARQEPQMGSAFAPDFLRQTRERERERARQAPATLAPPRFRFGWHIAAAVLAIGVLLQGLYLMRGQLAGHFPVLRPVLEAACAPLGCEVPPWRDIDALRIDTSQLQKQEEGSDAYLLAVTLRNQGRATTALPAIELVMTDLQDQLLLRRVLEPSEYLEPAQKPFAAQGLRAGMELPVRVRFRTQQAAANYRVLIFYP